MANAIYTAFLNGILGSHATRVDLDADTIQMVLTDHGTDTPAPTTDDFLDDISAGTVSTSSALASKTIGSVAVGVFDAADMSPAFTAVSGATCESINLYKHTGTATTSDLIAYWDSATGLPLTPNGGDVNVSFNASGIIKV